MPTWEHTFGAMQYYTLDENRSPRPIAFEEYLAILQKEKEEEIKTGLRSQRRRVAWDEVEEFRISTVFLDLDHNMWGKGDPVVFETMIFGPDEELDQQQWRYTTYEAALQGHHKAVTYVERFLHNQRLSLPPPPTPSLDQTADAVDQRTMDAFLDEQLDRQRVLALRSGEAEQEPLDILDLEPGGYARTQDPELPGSTGS